MLKILWHSLTRRRVQSLSIILAVAVSTGILLALYLLNLGVSCGMKGAEDRLGADILVIPADAWVGPEEVLFAGAPLNIYMDAGVEERISRVPGVHRATSQFFTQTLNADCCTLAKAARLIGFELNSDESIRSLLRDVKLESLGPAEIVAGARLDTCVGARETLLGRPFRVAALLKPTGTSLDYSILTSLETARALAKSNIGYLKSYWERYGQPENLVSAVLVEIDDRHDIQGVARAIMRLGDFNVVQTATVLTDIKGQMRSLFTIAVWGGILIAASSALGLFSRFFSVAWDRKGGMGTLPGAGRHPSGHRAAGDGRSPCAHIGAGPCLASCWDISSTGEASPASTAKRHSLSSPPRPSESCPASSRSRRHSRSWGCCRHGSRPYRAQGSNLRPPWPRKTSTEPGGHRLTVESVNVTKNYGEDTVLDGVSLKIEAGTSLAVAGTSGCGKSTFLSLLGLLLEPTEGEILFGGKKTSQLTDNERASIRNGQLGFVFQNPQLIGTLSVLENVLVPARLAGKRNLGSKAERLLEHLGLENRLKHLPYRLSVGQKRRVAVARALLLDPAVILADEPTNDLDPELAERVSNLLFDLPPEGKALVVVTHDENLARRASRSVRIRNGKVENLS